MGDESIPTPPPTAEAMEAMGKLVEESIKSGWLIQTGGFAPTSDAVKVRLVDGKFTTIDGPFAEAKELIGGWALVETASKEEAIEHTKEFLEFIGGGETIVRQVFGPED